MDKELNINLDNLKDTVIIDLFLYDQIIQGRNYYKNEYEKLKNVINNINNYILEDPNRKLSVDSYYEFKDLVEFDEIIEIIKKGLR